MPGPKSTPNGTKRDTPQYVPAWLAARQAAFTEAPSGSKFHFHMPGSQNRKK